MHNAGMTKIKYIDAVTKGISEAVAECDGAIDVR